MGPAAAESNVTIDLLKEAGYKYVMDWPADDQPFWLKTRSGPILSVPYPAELNNSASIIHRENTPQQFADMIVDQFDEMVEQCVANPLVMTLSLHPVRGRPAVPAAVAAQGAQALRRACQARPGVVDHAGAGRGLLLRAAAGNHSGRGAEITRGFASGCRPVYRPAKFAIQGGSHGSIIAPAPTRQKRHQQLGHRARLHVVFRRLWPVR